MVVSKITLVQYKIHHDQFDQWERDNSQLDTGINVLSMKLEITMKEFSYIQTVKDTAEGFTLPILQEHVVIFCIVRPNLNSVKKVLFLERM